MKTALYFSIVGLLVVAVATSAKAETSAACALKRQDIQEQMAHAKAAGRSQQVAGLEKALAANQAYCSDAGLEQERAEAIEKAQRKVTEREQELAQAQAKAEPEKIANKQAKLAQARQQLAQALQPVPR